MGQLRQRLGESLAAFRGVFANDNLRRAQLAFAGAVIGQYAYSIAVAVYAYQQGGATAVGVVSFVRLIVAAAVAPLTASLGDRFRRERVMLASDLVRALLVGLAAAAVFADLPALTVYVLATLTTIGGTAFRPAEAALLPTLARTPEELTAANVSSSTFDSLGSFLGPALGGVLLAVSGTGEVFVVMSVCFLWSASFVVRIRPEQASVVEPEGREGDGLRGLVEGFRAIVHEPRLRLLMGLYGAQAVVAGALGVLVVVTALDLLELGSSGVGFLESASGIGSLLGAGLALALVARKKLAADFGLGIVLWGLPLVLLGIFPNTLVALLALGVLGVGNTLVDIAAITLLQRTAPEAVASRVFGVLESTMAASVGIGSVLAPVLVGLFGARTALISTGALLPVLAALRWRQLQAIDEGAKVPQERVDALRRVPFIAPLPLRTIEGLAARLEPVELAAGQTLFERGDKGDRFYVVAAGELEVELDGEQRPAGPYVGEIALLRGVPRTASVSARTAATLWALERADFLGAVTGHRRAHGAADDIIGARLGFAPIS